MARSKTREELYELARKWEEEAHLDPRNHVNFRASLDEIFFHADLCFTDYTQYRKEGEFAVRLRNWLNNVSDNRSKRSLFELLKLLIFIDRIQMASLYRDAYRRIVIPFISKGTLSVEDILSIDYEKRILSLMGRYQLCSITESFRNPDFIHANDLTGLSRPIILGGSAITAGLSQKKSVCGLIIFEDFVGTGDQAKRILVKIIRSVPDEWRLLFVPLIILERGFKALRKERRISQIVIEPVLIMDDAACIRENATIGEPVQFKYIRSVVKATARKVLEPLGEYDDPPSDPFGYKGSGALVVTCHNTPNNTLSLVHHRAFSWVPLFRRIHHSRDGL